MGRARWLTIAWLLALALSGRGEAPVLAASPSAPASKPADDLVDAATNYRESLDRLVVLREAEVRRAQELLDKHADLYARGLIARRDFEDTARLLAAAHARLVDTQKEIVLADAMLGEAEAQRRVARLGPARPGTSQEARGLVVYYGRRAWSLGELPKVERFFRAQFGRPLPVSARGQTPVHDRMGLDHRHAVDVAIVPDSAEGQALMGFLRREGVSFLAYDGAVMGAATGAHIHIGAPSERLGLRPSAPDARGSASPR